MSNATIKALNAYRKRKEAREKLFNLYRVTYNDSLGRRCRIVTRAETKELAMKYAGTGPDYVIKIETLGPAN